MKYNIHINQKAIIDSGLDIDLTDAIIIDYMKDFANSTKTRKEIFEGKEYFWIRYEHLIDELPMVRLSKQKLKNITNKLSDMNILEKYLKKNNSTYFRFGETYELLISSGGWGNNNEGLIKIYQGVDKNLSSIKHNTSNIYKTSIKKKENSSSLGRKKTTDLGDFSVMQLIESWNGVTKEVKGWKEVDLRKPDSIIIKEISKLWSKIQTEITREEFNRGLDNYIKHVNSLKPSSNPSDYANHRFNLYAFLKQKNGLFYHMM